MHAPRHYQTTRRKQELGLGTFLPPVPSSRETTPLAAPQPPREAPPRFGRRSHPPPPRPVRDKDVAPLLMSVRAQVDGKAERLAMARFHTDCGTKLLKGVEADVALDFPSESALWESVRRGRAFCVALASVVGKLTAFEPFISAATAHFTQHFALTEGLLQDAMSAAAQSSRALSPSPSSSSSSSSSPPDEPIASHPPSPTLAPQPSRKSKHLASECQADGVEDDGMEHTHVAKDQYYGALLRLQETKKQVDSLMAEQERLEHEIAELDKVVEERDHTITELQATCIRQLEEIEVQKKAREAAMSRYPTRDVATQAVPVTVATGSQAEIIPSHTPTKKRSVVSFYSDAVRGRSYLRADSDLGHETLNGLPSGEDQKGRLLGEQEGTLTSNASKRKKRAPTNRVDKMEQTDEDEVDEPIFVPSVISWKAIPSVVRALCNGRVARKRLSRMCSQMSLAGIGKSLRAMGRSGRLLSAPPPPPEVLVLKLLEASAATVGLEPTLVGCVNFEGRWKRTGWKGWATDALLSSITPRHYYRAKPAPPDPLPDVTQPVVNIVRNCMLADDCCGALWTALEVETLVHDVQLMCKGRVSATLYPLATPVNRTVLWVGTVNGRWALLREHHEDLEAAYRTSIHTSNTWWVNQAAAKGIQIPDSVMSLISPGGAPRQPFLHHVPSKVADRGQKPPRSPRSPRSSHTPTTEWGLEGFGSNATGVLRYECNGHHNLLRDNVLWVGVGVPPEDNLPSDILEYVYSTPPSSQHDHPEWRSHPIADQSIIALRNRQEAGEDIKEAVLELMLGYLDEECPTSIRFGHGETTGVSSHLIAAAILLYAGVPKAGCSSKEAVEAAWESIPPSNISVAVQLLSFESAGSWAQQYVVLLGRHGGVVMDIKRHFEYESGMICFESSGLQSAVKCGFEVQRVASPADNQLVTCLAQAMRSDDPLTIKVVSPHPDMACVEGEYHGTSTYPPEFYKGDEYEAVFFDGNWSIVDLESGSEVLVLPPECVTFISLGPILRHRFAPYLSLIDSAAGELPRKRVTVYMKSDPFLSNLVYLPSPVVASSIPPPPSEAHAALSCRSARDISSFTRFRREKMYFIPAMPLIAMPPKDGSTGITVEELSELQAVEVLIRQVLLANIGDEVPSLVNIRVNALLECWNIVRGGDANRALQALLSSPLLESDIILVRQLIYAGGQLKSLDAALVIQAKEAEDSSSIERLVRCGANPLTPLSTGGTPMLEACRRGKVGIAKYLLENGGCPTSHDEISQLLFAAVRHKSFAQGDGLLLIEQLSTADVLAEEDSEGKTVLHLAALGGELSLVRVLLQCGALPSAADHAGLKPVHYAANKLHMDVVDELEPITVTASLRPEKLTIEDYPPDALHLAAERGCVQTIQKLIALGASTDEQRNGHTPLQIAQLHGHHSAIEILRPLTVT